jgi:hypothetical protein
LRSRALGSLVGTLSGFDDNFLTHGSEDGDEALLLSLFEDLSDFSGNVLQVIVLWQVHIGLNLTILVEKLQGGVVNVQEGVLNSLHDGSVNHITGMIGALVDLSSEDIFSLKNNLGRSVLSWFGGRNISDLAWVTLDHDKGSWLESVGIGLFAH